MSSFKERAFDAYVSTHLAERKERPSIALFVAQSRRWEVTLRRFLPADRAAAILDIGCGAGSVVWWLHQIGYTNAVGIDISPEQVAVAAEVGVPAVFQADLRSYLTARRGVLDMVMARDVFEHFERGELVSVLESVRESLKPGGLLVFQVPNGGSPFGGRIRYGDITHELAFTPTSVVQLARLTGYDRVAVFPVEPIVYGMKSWIRLLIWRAVQRFYLFLLAAELGGGANRIVSQNLIAVLYKESADVPSDGAVTAMGAAARRSSS